MVTLLINVLKTADYCNLRLETLLLMKMISFLSFLKQVRRLVPYVKGYNVDMKNVWKPTVNEGLETKMESDNVMGIYAVCVKKNTSIV